MKAKREAALIQQTIETWRPYFTQPLNEQDAEEILYRWTGFINIISQSLKND
jgi:hypothetical protein